MSPGDWYVTTAFDAPHHGWPRMSGWRGQVHQGLELGNCPRCHATVQAGGTAAFGDQTWLHEQWHARADHPVPPDVLALVPHEEVRRAYHPRGADVRQLHPLLHSTTEMVIGSVPAGDVGPACRDGNHDACARGNARPPTAACQCPRHADLARPCWGRTLRVTHEGDLS
jgi:hypothetical protein